MAQLAIPMTWLRAGQGNTLRHVALILGAAVLIQVTLMPRLDIGPLEAIPNLVVCAVVVIASYRGVVVGAICGFLGGILVELLLPGDSLGVLAVAYVAMGAWCGRFAAGPRPIGRVLGLLLCAGAAGLTPVWTGLVEFLRGEGPPIGYLMGDLVLPHLLFGALVSLPVLWAARRLLGEPREVEPWSGDAA